MRIYPGDIYYENIWKMGVGVRLRDGVYERDKAN